MYGPRLMSPYKPFNLRPVVVLYNLARMRESEEYNRLLSAEEVKRVMRKYGYTISLGDQDWFTNIGYEAPHLFYRLPCQFNAQVSVQYWR